MGPGFAARSLVASGTVFEARSADGQRRRGDRGLADVLVSNGRDVVKTDAEGRWWLPVAPGDSVFVVKPPNWSTPLHPHGLPRFSLLHQPLGSPVSHRHPGVASTGPLPASIDFALTPQPENSCFEVALLSDTQPENEAELTYLRDDIIVGLIGSDVAFGINHGDVVADDLSLYPRYLDLLRTTGVPWHHTPGNHDLNWTPPAIITRAKRGSASLVRATMPSSTARRPSSCSTTFTTLAAGGMAATAAIPEIRPTSN